MRNPGKTNKLMRNVGNVMEFTWLFFSSPKKPMTDVQHLEMSSVLAGRSSREKPTEYPLDYLRRHNPEIYGVEMERLRALKANGGRLTSEQARHLGEYIDKQNAREGKPDPRQEAFKSAVKLKESSEQAFKEYQAIKREEGLSTTKEVADGFLGKHSPASPPPIPVGRILEVKSHYGRETHHLQDPSVTLYSLQDTAEGLRAARAKEAWERSISTYYDPNVVFPKGYAKEKVIDALVDIMYDKKIEEKEFNKLINDSQDQFIFRPSKERIAADSKLEEIFKRVKVRSSHAEEYLSGNKFLNKVFFSFKSSYDDKMKLLNLLEEAWSKLEDKRKKEHEEQKDKEQEREKAEEKRMREKNRSTSVTFPTTPEVSVDQKLSDKISSMDKKQVNQLLNLFCLTESKPQPPIYYPVETNPFSNFLQNLTEGGYNQAFDVYKVGLKKHEIALVKLVNEFREELTKDKELSFSHRDKYHMKELNEDLLNNNTDYRTDAFAEASDFLRNSGKDLHSIKAKLEDRKKDFQQSVEVSSGPIDPIKKFLESFIPQPPPSTSPGQELQAFQAKDRSSLQGKVGGGR